MAKIDVKKVASLANLPITEEEEKLYQTQLEKILSYVDQIEEKVKTVDIKPTFNVSTVKDITSDDKAVESLTQEEVISNAPQSKNGFIVAKGVFKNE